MTPPEPTVLSVCGRAYRIDGLLHATERQSIFIGSDLQIKERVAIKIRRNENEDEDDALAHEKSYYQALKSILGIPRLHAYEAKNGYDVLITELLGPSIADLQIFIKERTGHSTLSIRTVCMLAIQLLDRLGRIHRRRLIHGDIKPDNIAIGLGSEQNRIYLFDFDLARYFDHAPGASLGTYEFASVRAYRGFDACAADDLESLLYVLIFLARGVLPWFDAMGVQDLVETKARATVEELCEGLPDVFVKYCSYVRSLTPAMKPNYHRMRGFFKAHLAKERFRWGNNGFDWILEAEKFVAEDRAAVRNDMPLRRSSWQKNGKS